MIPRVGEGNKSAAVALARELLRRLKSQGRAEGCDRPGSQFFAEECMALKVGEMAPDFEVPCVTGEQKGKFKLSDLKGKKNVVLAFYPLDWTPV